MKKEHPPVDTQERSSQVAIEQVRNILPSLRSVHDLFEDRSILANPDIADFLAGQFTTEGVEVFCDLANDLKETKRKQIEKE